MLRLSATIWSVLVVVSVGAMTVHAGEEPARSAWRYTTEKPADSWTAPEFDDSAWQTGPPGFGNQELPPFQRGRVNTPWEGSEIWVRFVEEMETDPWWVELIYSHDEDVEIYINGTLVLAEKGHITGYGRKLLDCGVDGAVRSGRNLVAAHCTQRAGGQFLDITLRGYTGQRRLTDPGAKIPRPEYPRPQLKRDQWLCLNGIWEFEIDREGTGLERGLHMGKPLAQSIVVPFPPESALSGVQETDFLKRVWYFRGVQVPEAWSGRKILLHFGAVDYQTTIWVNGRKAGEHRGGYTPFSLDITSFLVDRYAGITVLAEDMMNDGLQATGKQSRKLESHGCVYTRTTGIWQTVWLEPVSEMRVKGLKIQGLPDQKMVLINIDADGGGSETLVRVSAFLDGQAVGEAVTPVRWRGTRVALPISRVKLWAPGDPNLYDLMIRIESNGQVLDAVESYVGLRTIAIDGERVLINGKSLFQRLVLDQGFYPDGIHTAPSDEALVADIRLAMMLGFNGARLHMKVFEPRFLFWADRLGYLVWGEFPNWGLDHADPRALCNHLAEWLDVIARDYSHPSIVGWCPFNETTATQHRQGILNVYLATVAADPSRPVIDTSGYVHVKTDIADCHNYTQDPEAFRSFFEAFKEGDKLGSQGAARASADRPRSEQPFMVSEFGGIGWRLGEPGWGYGDDPQSEQEFYARFEALCHSLLQNPRIFGFCYTQLYDIEQEKNGLYTYDRKSKFDADRIREVLTLKAAIE